MVPQISNSGVLIMQFRRIG